MITPRLAAAAAVAMAAALTVGCGGGSSASGTTSGTTSGGRVDVAAAFYPLQFAVEQIGGSHVKVTPLTKPGAEPHDLELTPREVTEMSKATLIVYEHGLQPSVDDAVAQVGAKAGLDVAAAADLTLTAEGEDGGGRDPHFWLDPVRYAAVATVIGAQLAVKDPANAAAYAQGTRAFVAKLTALDKAYRTGLAGCAIKDIVTGHAAFGYLATRYGLTQVAIAGVSPDVEPDATAMRDIVTHVREHHVSTVYAETLVSPALAETIARETGAAVKVLDPIEGITKVSAGTDYLQVMASNLATLRAGQQCT